MAAQEFVVPRSMPTMVSVPSATPAAYYGPARAGRRAAWRVPGRRARVLLMDARRFLGAIGDGVKGAFAEQRNLLSFDEYLELFDRSPRAQARGAAQWLRDVVDHFGAYDIELPWGKVRRWRIYDLESAPEARAQRVAGHEEVQGAIYRALSNFVRSGRVNK